MTSGSSPIAAGRPWLVTVAVAVALAALVACSFAARWQLLSATPFPVGIDGYYYPIQLRALLEHGALQYPASPLAFVLLAPFAAITDPIVGAKLGAALYGALIAVPTYGVGARLGKSRGAGLLAAALATTSAGSTFMTIEYVKNGIGLTVAMTALWLGLRAVERASRGRIAAAALGVIAALLVHKMAAGVVVLVLVPAAIVEAVGRGALRGRRLLYVFGALAAGGLGLAILGLVAPRRFASPADLGLLGDLVSTTARWSMPALATSTVTLTMGYEAAIGAALAIVAAATLIRRHRAWLTGVVGLIRSPGETAAAWLIVGLALVIGVPWLDVADPQGLGFRLRVAAFVPMALAAAIGARPVLAIIYGTKTRASHGAIAAVLAAVAALAIPQRSDGEIVTHPALVAAALALTDRIPAGDTAIIPERHIAYMVAWYTRADVALRPEPIAREHRWRVMPLAFIGAGSALDDLLTQARREPGVVAPIGLHPRVANGMVLVAEPTWDWILARLPPAAQQRFTAWPTI